MNVKHYLQKYKRAKEREERYRERIAQIDDTLKGVNLDGMPRSTNLSDPTQIAALNLTLLKEQLQFAILDAERTRQQIAAEIERVENPQFCELLYSRYILLKPWDVVAERLRERREGSDYDIKYVMGDMHKRALRAFYEVIKNE